MKFVEKFTIIVEIHLLVTDFDCKTIGGNEIGVSCKFPFKYSIWDDISYAPNMIRPLARMLTKPVAFNSCTDYQNAGIMWCATNVTSNGRYIPGYWGNCPERIPCNNEEGNSIILLRVWYIPRY